ncbi:MAG: hypothetical protein Tsb0014_38590 [Pleurocapsa sp.]
MLIIKEAEGTVEQAEIKGNTYNLARKEMVEIMIIPQPKKKIQVSENFRDI